MGNSAVWMCMAVVVAVAGATDTGILHPNSEYCKRKDATLLCDATDDKTYSLDNFRWNDILKVIINGAPKLVLKYPLCKDNATQREVEVHNSTSVTTESGGSNCSQQLVIHDATNVRLMDGVDLVRLVNSRADEINLLRVSQFDLQTSHVEKVSVRVDSKKSIIKDSTIVAVKTLEINGNFEFGVQNSTLSKVEGFKYASEREATLKDTIMESVAANGFVVQGGKIKIQDSTINKLEALSLVVEGGKLVIANSAIYYVAFNSIVVRKGGTVLFDNVTVATKSEIFFTISDGTMDLYPLALLWDMGFSHSNAWVVLYVGIGMAVGLLVGAGVTRYMLKRKGAARPEADMAELLNREQPNLPSQPDSRPQNLPNNNNNNKNTPTPHSRPLPTPPQPLQDEEMYEQYSDVQAPPAFPPNRPPVPIPDDNSCSGGSTLPKRAHQDPVPHTLPKWRDAKGAEMKNDDRDKLPPPPPPDEELYDDLMADPPPQACTKPLPPIPLTKPQVMPPKKQTLPPIPLRKH